MKTVSKSKVSIFFRELVRKVLAFGVASSIFLTIGAWQVPAQKDPFSDSKNTEKLVDGYITVMTLAYPPAGGALKVAKSLITALGFFKQPDLVGEAIKQMNQRLDEIEGRVDKLQNEIVNTRNEGRENQNANNVQELRRLRETLDDVLLELSRKPPTQDAKDDIARKAERVANNLREVPKLWEWSDQAVKDHTWEGEFVKAGTFMTPDFKPMPTLEIYQAALVIWMAAIENASDGNKDVIANTYGNALQRHSEFLSVRPNFDEVNGTPETLPEKIKKRVDASYVPLTRLPDSVTQICSIGEYIQDDMARQRYYSGPIDYVARTKFEACNVPPQLANQIPPKKLPDGSLKYHYLPSPRELALEEAYGADSMSLLVQKMDQLKRTGTLREQFIGTFNTNFKADDFNLLYTVSQDGTLTWHRHMINYPGGNRNATAVHSFNPPKVLGSGWSDGVRDVMSASLKGIYSWQNDGTLQWSWHEGFSDGSPTWRGEPRATIAEKLSGFSEIIAQDEGVLYGRISTGDPGIYWGATQNYDNRKGMPKAGIGLRQTAQNINFAAFKKLFAGGKGVLYGIGHDGKLYWMKHNRYLSPVPAEFQNLQGLPGRGEYQQWLTQWVGPVEISGGFNGVTQAFSSGDGHIYYISAGGALFWRRHLGWEKGTNSWQDVNWNLVANGWGNYRFVFARITSSDLGSGIRGLDIIVN